ncbi:FITM2 [Branchiostoma lanceolatum]|uniref:FITM2 protein n=1 Tax=Branchiostoma lanceolatum TaxID=7740 RepID=A0A8K0A591_BRALA|nr:FITM2 [Branchiostoma lanceolatum]
MAPPEGGRKCSSLLTFAAKIACIDFPWIRLVLLWIVVIICSLVHQFASLADSYLNNTNNVLNAYFAEWSWAWTSIPTAIFVLLTSYVYTMGTVRDMLKHQIRIIIGTVLWGVWVGLFLGVRQWTVSCSDRSFGTNSTACEEAGHRWEGYDISGHTFLLSFCIFFITSELSVLLQWDSIPELLEKLGTVRLHSEQPSDVTNELTQDGAHTDDAQAAASSLEWFYRLTPFLWPLFCLLVLLTLLWGFLLVVTALYFHTVGEKLIGLFCGTLSWWMTYEVWYKRAFPGRPGIGPLGLDGTHMYSAPKPGQIDLASIGPSYGGTESRIREE